MSKHPRRAASLFEILMVAGIALILAAIGVISVRSLVIRTKVSRVMEEHRLISRAIQNYSLDRGEVPTELTSLTQPTAYLGTVPFDPFQKVPVTYLYIPSPALNMPSILISPGPNGLYDLPAELWPYVTSKVPYALIPPQALSLSMLHASMSAPEGENEPAAEREQRRMSETDRAILSLYLNSFQYNPARGDQGDIITLVH